MNDVNKIMLKNKDSLEKDIKLLTESQNIAIASNQYSWCPIKDTIWVFKTNYVDRIDQDKFVSAFCANDYFKDWIDDYEEMLVCPIGLYNDNSLGKVGPNNGDGKLRRVIIPTLKGMSKLYKNGEWWKIDDCENGCTKEFNESLDEVEKITYHGYDGKKTLKGSVIFHIHRGDFTTIRKIEKFLSDLDYCVGAGVALLNTVHFKILNQQVTVFEYDCVSE